MKELTCSSCLQYYNLSHKQPKSLRCGHTLCKECLLLCYSQNSLIECPQDGSKYYEEVDSLPDNSAVMTMLTDLEVRCLQHGQPAVDFCVTHLVACCELCAPHELGCSKKKLVEDANELAFILIKALDDAYRAIPVHPQILTDSYNRRFMQTIGDNIDLLYILQEYVRDLGILKCGICGGKADSVFDTRTFEALCETHKLAIFSPNMISIEGRGNEELRKILIARISETLKDVNYCSLTLEDLNFLSAKSSSQLPALQSFGKQLVAKSAVPRLETFQLPDISFCPNCSGVIKKPTEYIYILKCERKLHAICANCGNALQGQPVFICPLDEFLQQVATFQRTEFVDPVHAVRQPQSLFAQFNAVGRSAFAPSFNVIAAPQSSLAQSSASSLRCTPLSPIYFPGLYVLDRFLSVLPPSGLPPISMIGNKKGWHVNLQKNQVEVVTMTTFAPCVLTGIGLANPIHPGDIAIVDSVALFNGSYAYGSPVAEHKGGEQLVGGNTIITYINFRTGFQIPEMTKMTLKVKMVGPPHKRAAGVDLYRGNPNEIPSLWLGSDETIWEFEETTIAGEGEFVNGQNNLSGPILRFIYHR